MIVIVEGNIAVGKTTFLRRVEDDSSLRDVCHVHVLYEPLHLWQNLNGYNLLDTFYDNNSNDDNIAAELQYYIIFTMINRYLEALEIDKKDKKKNIVLMERSVYSGIECFARVLNKRGRIRDRSYEIMSKGAGDIMINLPKPDHIIYLKVDNAKVGILMDRILERGRDCESSNVNKGYLLDLNRAYDNMIDRYKNDIPVTVIPMTDILGDVNPIISNLAER